MGNLTFLCIYSLNITTLDSFHYSFSFTSKKSGPFLNPERSFTLLRWQVLWVTCTLLTSFTGKCSFSNGPGCYKYACLVILGWCLTVKMCENYQRQTHSTPSPSYIFPVAAQNVFEKCRLVSWLNCSHLKLHSRVNWPSWEHSLHS